MMINGIKYTLHLAPMAELTTPALRKVVKKFTANVVLYSEMLASGAINAKAPHNEPLVKCYDFDTPFFYQLVGNNPAIMANAATILQDFKCDGININMACSAPHILKTGGGASLLCNFNQAKAIIAACRKNVHGLLTVKIRAGFHDIDLLFLRQFVRMLQDEGVDAVIIHPRAAKWGFTRKAFWNIIEAIVTDITIPVIGNGDISEPVVALQRLQQTNCDGIMIGRAAVQKPWIFAQCQALLQQQSLSLSLDIEELWIEVLENIKIMLPVRLHKSRAHRFCAYYHKNVIFGHTLFNSIRQCTTIDDMILCIKNYFARNTAEKMKTI
ncbi:MAG: tRNA-dihydrouridine synthase family protein [Spirochaetota bacterium]